MDDREFLSEGEYFDGVSKDGRKPVYHSGEMTAPVTRNFSEEPAEPPVADTKRTRQQIEKDRLHYEINLVHLSQLDLVAKFARRMVDKGLAAMDGDDSPSSPASDGGALSDSEGDPPTAPRLHAGLGGAKAAADKPLTRSQWIMIGEHGAKLLLSVSKLRAEVAHELVDMAGHLDVRDHFMEDRATAVVHATLLHCNAQFSDLGFGAWMPFRWPDQWLSFCGILTRVLAANGLIHSKYADIYRKLLDETPPVEFEGTVQDRIKETRTPNNIAQCKANQGAYTMSELKTRLQTEVWGPKDQYTKLWETHWEDQLVKPKVPRRDGTVKPPYVPAQPPPKKPPPGAPTPP